MSSIGVGYVPHRIMSKTTLFAIGENIFSAAGPLQACANHSAEFEAAVHAMKELFDDNACEAALLVDASNAFNWTNHQAKLHNISALHNTYRVPVHLFINGKGEIFSLKDKIFSLKGQLRVTPCNGNVCFGSCSEAIIRCLRSNVLDASQVWFVLQSDYCQ